MANYTALPEDEYDVLIDGDLSGEDVDPCPRPSAGLLSAQQAGQLSAALFTVGLLANGLVLFILVKHKGLRHVENIYFLNVALSNLCFLLPLPIWAAAALPGGGLGHTTCRVLHELQSLGQHGEALFNALVTVHASQVRGLASVLRTGASGIVSALLAWVVAFLVTLPELVFFKPLPDEASKCSLGHPHLLPAEAASWERALTLKMNVLVLALPLLVLLGSCLRRRSGEAQRKRFKLACAVVAVFLLMWAPYNAALFLSAFKDCFSLHGCQSRRQLQGGVEITRLIATAHCCINLLLYVLLDREFRGHLCSLVPRPGRGPPRPGGGESAQAMLTDSRDQSTQL